MEPSKFIQRTLAVGPLACNCQILVCPRTHEAILVDPGDEPDTIIKNLTAIEKEMGAKIKVKGLFHTHAHFDHIGGTRKVKEHFLNAGIEAPQIFLHKEDEFIYQNLTAMGERFGMKFDAPLPVDQYFQDEQEFRFGEMKITILHTPGHSPGGVCFRLHQDTAFSVPEMVFTGDTLFRESVGRSDLWGGDEGILVKSIHQRLLSLDGDTVTWPGHGPQTTIGHEKKSNPYI